MQGADVLETPYAYSRAHFDSLPQIEIQQHYVKALVQCDHGLVGVDPRLFRAGDLVLSKSSPHEKWRSTDAAIRRYQKALFPDAPHVWDWTHVGMLDDDLHIWDAMPDLHVRQRPLRDALRETGVLCLRRPRIAVKPAQIVKSLLEFSNAKYRMLRIETGGLLMARVGGLRASQVPRNADASEVICSVFIDKVLNRATGLTILRDKLIVVPADFAVEPIFETIPFAWLRPAALDQ